MRRGAREGGPLGYICYVVLGQARVRIYVSLGGALLCVLGRGCARKLYLWYAHFRMTLLLSVLPQEGSCWDV